MKTVRTELKEYWICEDCPFETDEEWSYYFHLEEHSPFPPKYKEIYIERLEGQEELKFYRFDSEQEFNVFSTSCGCKDFSPEIRDAPFEGEGWYEFRLSEYGGFNRLRKSTSTIESLKQEIENISAAIEEIEKLETYNGKINNSISDRNL